MKITDLTKVIAADLPSLGSVFANGLPAYMGASFGQQLNKLTSAAVSLSDFDKDLMSSQKMVEAIGAVGIVMAEADGPEEEGTDDDFVLWARVRAGWLNANPALVAVIDGRKAGAGTIQVAAFAKEGFISQKTATGAIRRIERALENRGIAFKSETIVPQTVLDLD